MLLSRSDFRLLLILKPKFFFDILKNDKVLKNVGIIKKAS
jgi:hypothetical protein